LRRESWARQRLQQHAGKTIRFCLPPFPDLALTVQADGEVSAAAGDAPDDAALILSPDLPPRLLAGDEGARREIRISGDVQFAEEIIGTISNLNWDVEQELSSFMGDILAHRVAQCGRMLMRWHVGTFRNLFQALKEYCTEEHPMLAKPVKLHSFAQEVESLQDKTAYLEKRVNALIAR
jgi:ubiquinone biosynthesis protein UbiJ